MTNTRMIVAGKITKRGGQVLSSTILAQPVLGMSQRWGLAAFDPRSGRHDKINCLSCQGNFH